jgi:hypothetical protein
VSGTLVRSVVTGPLFAGFCSAATGRSVTRNLSGRRQFVFHPRRLADAHIHGHVGIGLHVGDTPSGQFLVISGHTILTISPMGAKTLTQLDGTAENICRTPAG